MRIAQRRPITDLAREARAVIELVHQRQEPIVITQRGREVAVLVPVELYRKMQGRSVHRILSPRLANPDDAARLRTQMTVAGESPEEGEREDAV